MNTARQEMLDRIRQALAGAPLGLRYDAIRRDYIQAGLLEPEQRIQLFEDRVRDYGAGIRRCASNELPTVIHEIALQRGKSSLVITRAFPYNDLPDSIEFLPDDELSVAELDRCEGVLTSCAVAIAVTGTIVLRHTQQEGRRVLTLIPDYHLCVVRTEQIVETVVQAIRVVAQWKNAPITTISGPSATSDIEMTRVKGVHGPRTLDVIIATE